MSTDNLLDLPEQETSFPIYKSKMGNVKSTPLMYVLPFVFAFCFVGGLFNGIVLILLIPCVPLLFSASWIIIDLNSKRFRSYWTFYGFKIGNWKFINGITAVSVVRMKRITRRGVGLGIRGFALDMVDEESIYKVKLVDGKERMAWDIMNVEDKEKALAIAKRIAERLGVEMRDFSTPTFGAIKRRR